MADKYMCAKCGQSFEGKPPHIIGVDDLCDYPDGTWVPDIAIYVCEGCYRAINQERRDHGRPLIQ